MKSRSFIVIEPFMIDYKLPQTELFCLAIIHSFSKQQQGCFYGTQGYLAEQIKTSRQAVNQALLRLEAKGLITKTATLKRFEYATTVDNQGATIVAGNAITVDMGATTIDAGATTVAQIINNNKTIEKLDSIGGQATKHTPKRFIKPTLEQVTAYCQERGNNVDPQRFIDFYESKGWLVGKTPMKDWKACVRTWEKDKKPTQGAKPNIDYQAEAARWKG